MGVATTSTPLQSQRCPVGPLAGLLVPLVIAVCALSWPATASKDDFHPVFREEQQQNQWHMKPVTVLMSRATGQKPDLQPDGSWTTEYPLSSVNTASLYGGLKYVHTEAINYPEVIFTCTRKNGADYIIFMELTFANPPAALAYYRDSAIKWGEFGQYVTMDGGACHSQAECNLLYGDYAKNAPVLGPFVGIQKDDDDDRAPYPLNYWYSLPGECPLKEWKDKTEECVKEEPGGRCPDGVVPDGIQCSWAYTILGYIELDELVGIKHMVNEVTGQPYTNYTDFCLSGGVEFERGPDKNMKRGLDFWDNPRDPDANWNRTLAMLELYNNKTVYPHNRPIVADDELTLRNPKCFENLHECNPRKTNGCYRDHIQHCRRCDGSQGVGVCEVAPVGFQGLPDLPEPELPPGPPTPEPPPPPGSAGSNAGGSGAGGGGGGGGGGGSSNSGISDEQDDSGDDDGDGDSPGISSGTLVAVIVATVALILIVAGAVIYCRKNSETASNTHSVPLLSENNYDSL